MTGQPLQASVLLAILLAGCSSAPNAPDKSVQKPASAGTGEGRKKPAARKVAEPEDDEVFQKGDTPEQQRYMEAGKPFIIAVAKNDPAAVYACLSSHARAQMQLMQFKTPTTDVEHAKMAQQVFNDVSAEKFAELFGEVVKTYGEPKEVRSLYCFQTDPKILAGVGEPIEIVFAIGGMPKSLPNSIRRASVRGQVGVKWQPDELARAARELGCSEEEVLKDPDSQPYFNLKFVLVEEDGELKVGYFEFMPPSMLD